MWFSAKYRVKEGDETIRLERLRDLMERDYGEE